MRKHYHISDNNGLNAVAEKYKMPMIVSTHLEQKNN